MADSGKIPIGDARKISRERQCPLIVIFAINPDRESFTVTTYGATKGIVWETETEERYPPQEGA